MNNNFTLADLFMDKKMRGVFPQFGDGGSVQQVYSFAEQVRQVKEHIRGLLKARKAENGDLEVSGNHSQVMAQVNTAKAVMEKLFNSMPSISKNLRAGTKLYMGASTKEQMRETKDFDGKINLLNDVLDNITFNENFRTTVGAIQKNLQGKNFHEEQRKWKQKVNWRG